METLTKRLLILCDYLVSIKRIKNDREFAGIIGITPGLISDIRNGRKDPGLKVIQGIAKMFTEVNIYWLLLGSGEMINAKTPPTEAEGVKNSDDLSEIKSLLFKIESEQNKVLINSQTILQAVKKADQTAQAGTTPEQRSAAALEQIRKNRQEAASGSKAKK